jgi:hypothetical protein
MKLYDGLMKTKKPVPLELNLIELADIYTTKKKKKQSNGRYY